MTRAGSSSSRPSSSSRACPRARATANATRALASALASTSASTSIAREGASELGRVLAPGLDGERGARSHSRVDARTRARPRRLRPRCPPRRASPRIHARADVEGAGEREELRGGVLRVEQVSSGAFVVSTTAAGFALIAGKYRLGEDVLRVRGDDDVRREREHAESGDRTACGRVDAAHGRTTHAERTVWDGFALTFAGACAVGGVGTLAVTTNETTAALGRGTSRCRGRTRRSASALSQHVGGGHRGGDSAPDGMCRGE